MPTKSSTEIGRVSSVYTKEGRVYVNVQLSRAGAEVRNIPFSRPFSGAMVTPQEGDIVEVYQLRDGTRAARFTHNPPSGFSMPDLDENELVYRFDSNTELSFQKNGSGDYDAVLSASGTTTIKAGSKIVLSAPDISLGGSNFTIDGTILYDTSAAHVPATTIEQGPGSGLDADTVDGYDAAELGGGTGTGVDVSDDGTLVVGTAQDIDFKDHLTVTNDADNTVSVTVDEDWAGGEITNLSRVVFDPTAANADLVFDETVQLLRIRDSNAGETLVSFNGGTPFAEVKLRNRSQFTIGHAGSFYDEADGDLVYWSAGTSKIRFPEAGGIELIRGNLIDASGNIIYDNTAEQVPQQRVEQGSGSGLDADTVDGLHASELGGGGGAADNIFLAEGSSTNLNQPAWVTVSWTATTFSDSAYTFDGSTVTIQEAGAYEIVAEADFTTTGTTRQSPNIGIKHNGSWAGVLGRTGYMRNLEGHYESSIHSRAVISASAGDLIHVEATGEADTSIEITPERAQFYIKKLNR